MKRGLGSFLYHIVQDCSDQASNFWPHTPQQKACLKMLQATKCEAFLHSAANFRKNRSLFMICKIAHYITRFFFYSTILIERFSDDCPKTKPKQLLRPITTGEGSAMSQSQFLAITCNSLEAREKSRIRGWCDWFLFWFSLVEKLARV